MRVIGDHENAVARDSNAAVGASPCFAQQTGGPRNPKHPDLASGDCIERVGFVRSGDVHDAFHHNRSDLQPRRAGHRENPGGRQMLHAGRIDLFE